MGKDARQNNEHAEIPANLLGHDLTWLNSRSQTDSDGECHCPVCNPPTEGLCLAPLLIHMVGKEITRMSGMQNDDRLGDDVPESLPSFVEIRIVKILFFPFFLLTDLSIFQICRLILYMKYTAPYSWHSDRDWKQDVSLVHSPGRTNRALSGFGLCSDRRAVANNPAVQRGVINVNTALTTSFGKWPPLKLINATHLHKLRLEIRFPNACALKGNQGKRICDTT